MSLPGDLSTVVVTGSFTDVAGTPLQGTVSFTPSSNLTDATGHVVVPATSRRYVLSGGTFTSDPLVATDNATLSPAGWAYVITIAPQDITAYSVTVTIPHSPSPVDLSVLAPAISPVTYASYLPLSGGTMTGPLIASESPQTALEVATKGYVDTATTGLDAKPAVRVATTAALAANTYASGVLTATANGALTVDGVTVALADRVLVKNESAQADNGVYNVTQTGSASLPYILTRAADMNSGSEVPGALVLVESGTANTDTGWFVTSPGPFTLGTTAIVWAFFSGGVAIDTTDTPAALGAAAPGAIGKASDAGHIHPTTNIISGVTVSGTAASGKVIQATSSSAATWTTPASGVTLDSSDNPAALGAASPGVSSQASPADHVHPFTSNIGGVAVSGTAASGKTVIASSSSAAAWTLPLQIDTTGSDIQPLGSRSAGVLTQAAAADHIHPTTSVLDAVTVSGTPVAGEVMVATSGTAATWQVPQGQLTPTAVKTSAYSANPLDFVPVDTTSGSVTVTLPNAPADLTVLGVKMVILAGANTVTIARSGSDVFNKSGGSTSLVLTRALQTVVLLYHSGIWYVTATDPAISIDTTSGDIAALGTQAAGSTAKAADAGHVHPVTGLVTSVAATDTSIVVTNGSTNSPTVATGTLDVIAAQHPPAASVALNSQRITGLASGTGGADAATVSQAIAAASDLYRQPAGATGATFSRSLVVLNQSAMVSGTLYVTAITLPAGVVVSNMTLMSGGTAKTGGSHGWYILCDSGMVCRAVTADQTDAATVWGGTNALYTLATNAYTTSYTGLYYIGVMVAATGMPLFNGAAALTSGVLVSTAPALSGTSSTGQTTPPTPGTSMTAISAARSYYFYAYTS